MRHRLTLVLLLTPLALLQAADTQKPAERDKPSRSWFARLFEKNPPTPVVSAPFDLAQKGKKAEIVFRASDRRSYPIGIRFYSRPPQDDDRVRTPLVRLKLFRIDGPDSELIYEQEIKAAVSFAWNEFSIGKMVYMPALEPGNYKAEIESLKDYPELAGRKIELEVTSPKR